jgi:ABC-type transport system involved in multi-copper enzyme maturation permease subunit
MRLLRAELRKLNRPLLFGVAAASALFCVLLAVGGSSNARPETIGGEGRVVRSCEAMALPPGPSCSGAQAIQRARLDQLKVEETTAAAHTAAQLDPTAAGAEAAGLMASLPGALALALLAGGHVGGEWSGRTLKNLLTQHGRRRHVLAAKLASLWLAGVGLVVACWAALAVAGPILVRVYHLPDPHQSFTEAARWAGSQFARSLLVLAVFAVVGLLAAVLTRGTIGTTATTAGAFVMMLVVATVPSSGTWTPATWVQGWMGFPVGQRSITDLPSNFWSRFIHAGGSPPSHLLGLWGLVATLAACWALALLTFQRSDVTG